jgi:hypothetical protein
MISCPKCCKQFDVVPEALEGGVDHEVVGSSSPQLDMVDPFPLYCKISGAPLGSFQALRFKFHGGWNQDAAISSLTIRHRSLGTKCPRAAEG